MRKFSGILLMISIMEMVLVGCGEKEKPHEHTWVDATCTEVAFCKECGETNGEALGHSTEVGECSRCKEYQGKEIVQAVLDKVSEANKYCTEAVELETKGLESAESVSDAYLIAIAETDMLQNTETSLQDAYDLCGSYSELATIKKSIKDTMDREVSYPRSEDYDDMMDWCDEVYEYTFYVRSLESDVETLVEKTGCTYNFLLRD